MANLVLLQFDKETGRIVATGSYAGGGGGGGGGGNDGGIPRGYHHQQIVAAEVWEISHNMGTKRMLCQVFDDVDEMVIPAKIVNVDINTVRVEFPSPQTGYAHIMFFMV